MQYFFFWLLGTLFTQNYLENCYRANTSQNASEVAGILELTVTVNAGGEDTTVVANDDTENRSRNLRSGNVPAIVVQQVPVLPRYFLLVYIVRDFSSAF